MKYTLRKKSKTDDFTEEEAKILKEIDIVGIWTTEDKNRYVEIVKERGRDYDYLAKEFPDKTRRQVTSF